LLLNHFQLLLCSLKKKGRIVLRLLLLLRVSVGRTLPLAQLWYTLVEQVKRVIRLLPWLRGSMSLLLEWLVLVLVLVLRRLLVRLKTWMALIILHICVE
jgi:hypothetical protein